MSDHFALTFAKEANEYLHMALSPTQCYRHEIYEVPGVVTALFITYDSRREDEFIVKAPATWEEFKARLIVTKQDWDDLEEATVRKFDAKPEKSMGGWEGQNIYLWRGGSHAEQWTPALANQWLTGVLSGSAIMWGPMLKRELEEKDKSIPLGRDGAAAFEHLVKVSMNYLFGGMLTDGSYQVRTEEEGLEIRDLIYRNAGSTGFWSDLREKYQCSEIIFETKNKNEVSRDDLRQIYCYLKPATGLFGILVSRGGIPSTIAAYNRQLFRNFAHERGVLIVTAQDIEKMIAMKLRRHDPAEQLAFLKTEFVRGI